MHKAPKNTVVIGGGIAGATISRVLAAAGVQVTLLEKAGQLCSGSTWHAAGLVTRFAGSPKLKKIHVRSLEMMTDLHDKFGVGLHTPGSIRIIEKGDEDRLREAKQHLAMAALYDNPEFPTRLISSDEVAQLHPLINIDRVECGLYTPFDGDVDPTSLTNTVAKLAREHGAKVRFNAEVLKIDSTPSGGFAVHVKGDDLPIECDSIVNAAGLWSRRVSDMAPAKHSLQEGISHPAFVIEHQYAITETVPAVKKLSEAGHNGGRLPVLRDLRGSSYIRQEGNGFLIGPYESECIVRTDMPRGPPSDFIMELFPDKLDRIEENLMMGMELVPCLGEVGFRSVVNGPTIWTGDSLARCGRTTIPGWYDFNSLTYGIAQSLGLADYLGHIMLEGEQPAWLDATDYFDPLRYGSWANDSFTVDKIKETYTHNNRVSYGSYENRSGGRAYLEPPYQLYNVLADHGARFGAFGGAGCEVPLCYVPAGNEPVIDHGLGGGGAATAVVHQRPVDFHDEKRFHNFAWAEYAEEEATHVLEKVGLAYSSFSKIRVQGPDAKAFMQDVTTRALPVAKADESDLPCRLTYSTTPKGRVQTEFTICRMNREGNDWYLVGSRDHVRQDIAWLKQCLAGRDCTISDMTNDICVLHLAGPLSGELLGAIEPRIQGLPFMRARPIKDFARHEGLDVQVFRVSFSGEMGFELHFASSQGPLLHDILWEHEKSRALDLRHVGSASINSLRIEKGFKFRGDLDYSHYKEAGIDAFVTKKRSFIGKDDSYIPQKTAAMFVVETAPGWEWSVVGDSPIRRSSDKAVVGYTTTSCRGASTKQTVALGYVLNDKFFADGQDPVDDGLYIETFGFQWPVKYHKEPLRGVDRTVW